MRPSARENENGNDTFSPKKCRSNKNSKSFCYKVIKSLRDFIVPCFFVEKTRESQTKTYVFVWQSRVFRRKTRESQTNARRFSASRLFDRASHICKCRRFLRKRRDFSRKQSFRDKWESKIKRIWSKRSSRFCCFEWSCRLFLKKKSRLPRFQRKRGTVVKPKVSRDSRFLVFF